MEQVQADWNQSDSSRVDYIKNKPTIPVVPTNVSSFTNDAGYLTQHQDISGKANVADLATVATSGSYNDLSNKPTIPDTSTLATKTELNAKQDKINDLASIRINSGKGVADVSSNADGTVVCTLANGDTYTIDLNHEHPQYVESDDLADVATSGSYNDLTDKPTIPAAQVQSDWNASSGMGVILNKPTIPSKTSDLTNDSGFINRAMYYGECTTAAATMPKVCTVETFPTTTSGNVTHAKEGTVIAVKFSASDTNTTDAPTLNVNGIGAKAIMYNNAIVTSTAKNTTIAGYAKQIAYYRYDPSLDDGNGAWEYLGKNVDSNSTYTPVSLGFGYALQNNASSSATITATLSSYTLTTNGIVSVKFNYDVPANATLNVNGKGAKAIYNRGAAIAAGVIKAGDTATFIYSTYYHLISIDRSDSVTVDSTITQNGTNPVQGGAIYSALKGKVGVAYYVDVDEMNADETQDFGTLACLDDDSSFYIWNLQDMLWYKVVTPNDLYSYVPTYRTINGKALSSNVTLTASDVGAYQKPANGIPASDIAPGVIPDVSGLATKTELNAKANTSSLAPVATSGSYNDLSNKPTIPDAQVNADWNATSGVSRILNKPTIPTVPTKVSSFTNDAGYLTQHQSLANYYTKSEIDTKIGNIETLLASI